MAKIPNWVVPTTPITAYAKAGSAVCDPDTGERLALFDPKTRAQGMFLDPAMALTAPAGLARSAALNAFAMAVESLQACSDDPLAEALLVHALRMLAQWLPRLHGAPEDPEPRLRLMLAALLCGQGTDYVGGGLAQGLSHAAGPQSSVSNGVVEALLLPYTMRFNAPVTGVGLTLIADALDTRSPAEPAAEERAIAAVERFLADLAVRLACATWASRKRPWPRWPTMPWTTGQSPGYRGAWNDQSSTSCCTLPGKPGRRQAGTAASRRPPAGLEAASPR